MPHTPGPWSIRRRANQLGAPNGRFVILGAPHSTRGEFFVCEMPFAAVRGDDGRESEANGRLIAAAPDLLAALKNVVAVADRKTVEFDAARAAIAKATGQE